MTNHAVNAAADEAAKQWLAFRAAWLKVDGPGEPKPGSRMLGDVQLDAPLPSLDVAREIFARWWALEEAERRAGGR